MKKMVVEMKAIKIFENLLREVEWKTSIGSEEIWW